MGHAEVVFFFYAVFATLFVAFAIIIVYIVSGGFGADERRAREERIKRDASFQWVVNSMVKEHRQFEVWKNDLVMLKWPELRKLCENETGSPCECPTKAKLAQRIWHVRKRREARKSGLA